MAKGCVRFVKASMCPGVAVGFSRVSVRVREGFDVPRGGRGVQ